jgi:hypothetical protein
MITNIKKANQLRIRDKTHTLDMSDLRPNNPDSIVLHSTRTYKTFEEVLACHKKRGFAGVGYHFFYR